MVGTPLILLTLLLTPQFTHSLNVTNLLTKGYFIDTLGTAKFIDHAHRFLFTADLSPIARSLGVIQDALTAIPTTPNITSAQERLITANQDLLKRNVEKIQNILHKLRYHPQKQKKITKRGLINGLGSVIKFIAGNPDNDDLEFIKGNLDNLEKEHDQEMARVNKLTSINQRLTQLIQNTTRNLNENFLTIGQTLKDAQRAQDVNLMFRSIELQVHKSFITLLYLRDVEQTVTLATAGIPSLEMIRSWIG